MPPSPHRDTIDRWISDFLDAPFAFEATGPVREYAPEILVAFVEAAANARGLAPDELEEEDVRAGLLEGVARLEMPGSVREQVPGLCAAFLEAMEVQGRLGGGGLLASAVRALGPRYRQETSGKGVTYRAPAAKIGRNDPCPCGSGRKYKKCCQGRLGPS